MSWQQMRSASSALAATLLADSPLQNPLLQKHGRLCACMQQHLCMLLVLVLQARAQVAGRQQRLGSHARMHGGVVHTPGIESARRRVVPGLGHILRMHACACTRARALSARDMLTLSRIPSMAQLSPDPLHLAQGSLKSVRLKAGGLPSDCPITHVACMPPLSQQQKQQPLQGASQGRVRAAAVTDAMLR